MKTKKIKLVQFILLIVLVIAGASCEKNDPLDPNAPYTPIPNEPVMVITLPEGKTEIRLGINAASDSERKKVWIDLNANGKRDSNEGVNKFWSFGEELTKYPIKSRYIAVYGNVTHFVCSSNDIIAIDVSKNTELRELSVSMNQITSIDLSKNDKLKDLSCAGNPIDKLDVSKNTELEALQCSYCNLSALDVSKNTKLVMIECSYNQLTSLKVPNSKNLNNVLCYTNNISGNNMTELINSLPTVEYGEFYVIDTKNPDEKNVCTKAQVNAAKAKKWTVFDVNDWNVVEYQGS